MNNNLSLLTKENIQSGELQELIPELYELKDVVENNNWHNNQNVYDHTLIVLKNLEEILPNISDSLKEYLKGKVDNVERGELLKIAAIFHDIAKKETLVSEKGVTKCIDHPFQGSEKVKGILKRLELSETEIEIVSRIIKNHDLISKVVLPDNPNLVSEMENIKNNYKDIYPELLLQTYADTFNSYLSVTKPNEYEFRIKFYLNEISSLLT